MDTGGSDIYINGKLCLVCVPGLAAWLAGGWRAADFFFFGPFSLSACCNSPTCRLTLVLSADTSYGVSCNQDKEQSVPSSALAENVVGSSLCSCVRWVTDHCNRVAATQNSSSGAVRCRMASVFCILRRSEIQKVGTENGDELAGAPKGTASVGTHPHTAALTIKTHLYLLSLSKR